MYSLRSLGFWFLSIQSPLLESWLLFLLWVWAVRDPGWCTRNFPVAAPILLDTEQHWILLILPLRLILLFSTRRAGSPLPPCLGTNKQAGVVLRAVGSAFIISAVSGTVVSGECTKLGFILSERGLGPLRNLRGCVCGLVCCSALRRGVDSHFSCPPLAQLALASVSTFHKRWCVIHHGHWRFKLLFLNYQ